MNSNRTIEAYLRGDASLPATFTTGFRKDLETARQLIKARKSLTTNGRGVEPPADDPTGCRDIRYG